MIDREKVIYSIERCICHVPDACRDCSYDAGHPYNECFEMLLKDVLELLKEQEPAEAKTMGESKFHGSWWFACGACGHAIDPEDNFCRECGRKIKWDD